MTTDGIIHRGAGILFVTPEGKALFLKRGNGGDAPGAWCFPGGTTEEGETPEQTAIREAEEELGSMPKGTVAYHTRTISDVPATVDLSGDPVPMNRVDFTTFVQGINAEFAPTLNGEHTGWAWAPIDQPPEPLHPGCRIALARIGMDELAVARAMADGLLTSPQQYANMHLVDMRITGTGVSERGEKKDKDGKVIAEAEYVYRRPENYLTDEFVQRCNGLQVIMKHPEKSILDSKEFGERTVGAMMLPYIKGNEVWGIAKIYDDETMKILQSTQMSTSPGVLLKDGNYKLKTEDGKNLLVEGKPHLLDHLAIVKFGVWDKGGDPSGIRTDSQGDITMPLSKEDLEVMGKLIGDANASLKTELLGSSVVARADEASTKKFDSVMTAMDAMCGKMDSFAKRMDEFEKKADSSKKDEDVIAADEADEEAKKKADADEADAKAKADAAEEEKKKADAALAENATLKARLEVIERNLPKQLTDEDRHAFSAAQARADDVYSQFGKRAPQALNGETVLAYRQRLVAGLKDHSPAWREVDVLAIADAATFAVAEKTILADAVVAARTPSDLKVGELRAIHRNDAASGHRITEFVGRGSFIHAMTRAPRRVRKIGVQA